MQYRFIFISLFFLSPVLRGQSAAHAQVKVFTDSKKRVEISLKETWKLEESAGSNVLNLRITPAEAQTESFHSGVLIEWHKTFTIPGQSYTPAQNLAKDAYNYRLTNPDSLFLMEEYDAQPYNIDGFEGLLSDREIQITAEGPLLREYELILARNGELLRISMRSTDDYHWDELMPMYQKALKEMKLKDFMP
jgi:hypothetical protein